MVSQSKIRFSFSLFCLNFFSNTMKSQESKNKIEFDEINMRNSIITMIFKYDNFIKNILSTLLQIYHVRQSTLVK